jgi:5S rRNA maturation endonuclease (ribonuclease M5)
MLVSSVGGEGSNPVEILREIRHKAVGRIKDHEPDPVETPPDPEIVWARYEDFRFPPEWAWSDRKISYDAVEAYGLKWDRGWIIPIWSSDSVELWGWQFKRMDFVSNYPKAVKKSQTLFGLRELHETTVVLVESPLDVARLATVGVSAVAAYGAFVSKAQLRLLIEVADRIILALDNDEEGQRQTDKIFPYLSKFVPTIKVTMPAGAKDPGELSDKKAKRVFENV